MPEGLAKDLRVANYTLSSLGPGRSYTAAYISPPSGPCTTAPAGLLCSFTWWKIWWNSWG